MDRKKIRIIIYALLVAILVCALVVVGWGFNWWGCSLQDNGGTTTPPSGEGVLNLYGIDPWTLDPAVSSEMTSHQYIVQIFSGLVRLDENLQPVPDIALSWDISEDGTVYTFYLRQDVYFQDGRQVTAADFEYSWERACNPQTGSQTAAVYLDDIVGVDEVLAGTTDDISGIRVISDFVLEVTIDAPKAYFLSKLTFATAFVVDRFNVESGEDWWQQPNGTGPFRLGQWQPNELLVLERNELYYGQMAEVESVAFQLWGGVPMNMYETGEIDATSVGSDYIYRVTDETGPFYLDLEVMPELSFYYIGFNTEEPPFDDVNIRLAFSMAIDRELIVSLVFSGTMQPAYGILPPGMPGYNQDLIGVDFDVEGALELIANSSYGDVSNLPPITITTIGWGGLISPELEAIVYQWRENLGVEVTIRQLEPERFLYHLGEESDQMFYTGWIADYPHPQDFLEILFHSGSEHNYGGYSNPEVDELLDMAGVEPDSALSFSLYRQAEQLLVDDAACLPIAFGQNYTLVKPYVSGYNLNPMGLVMLNLVSVEPH
jgi:oligopeptide transport system substrate-binding protein